jgi:glycosyltransferase involved in cell wall biosynthesis
MDDQKALSVIIPTHNRAIILEKCIMALSRQSVSHESYEVIVSDDGSQDDTRERVERAAGDISCPVLYLHQPNQGANRARNRAVAQAAGRLLLFINDDTIASPTMLEQHLVTHHDHPEENVGVLGRIVISPDVPPSFFAKLHLGQSYDYWKGRRDLDWRAFYTCNVSVKKTFLVKYGLFEETLRYHEDVELSERLSHHGFRLIYNPDALGYHDHFLTEEGYLRAAGLDGKALAVWHRKAPALRGELAFFGFAPTASLPQRLKHKMGDVLVNRLTTPYLLKAAQYLSTRCEAPALFVYRKIYQAMKREAVRNALAKQT